MRKTFQFLYPLLCSALLIYSVSCKKDKLAEPPKANNGHIQLVFAHYVDGLPLQKDTMKYTNEAGNEYEVDEVKYFISDVVFYAAGGKAKYVTTNAIKYIDINIPATLTWNIGDLFPVGTYDSIAFRFGIIKAKNISYMFVNPPEVNMAWPDMLGGGYHLLQINGKWKDTLQQIENFNSHIGLGRVINGNDTTFVDNSFPVKLANSGFTLEKNDTTKIQIIMNIESWYKTPFTYNHNHYGQMIMQNQEAMHVLSANGFDVFSIGYKH